jgi:hypothetical protein
MFKSVIRVVLFIVIALIVMVAPTVAHEGREVEQYQLYFGWREEPAYTGMMNGPEIFISYLDAGEEEAFPEDVEVQLQTEVMFGDQTVTVPLRAAWGTTGHYLAELVPTLPGDYTFRVFGTIGETEVDETFDSADGEFSTVEPAADIMFPVVDNADARITALEAQIAELEARLAALEAQ